MKKWYKSILVICLILTSILFTACGKKDNNPTKDNVSPSPIIGEEPTVSPESTGVPSANNGTTNANRIGTNTNGTGVNTNGTGVNTDGTGVNTANDGTSRTVPNNNTTNTNGNGTNTVTGLDGTNNGTSNNSLNTDMASRTRDGSTINSSTTNANSYTRYNKRNGEYTVRPSYIEGDNQLVYALAEMVGETDHALVSTFGTGILNQSEEENPMLISREYTGELYDEDVIITAMFGDNQTIDEFVIYFEKDELNDIKREMTKDFGQAKDVLDTTNTKSVKDKSEKATYRATWEIDGTQVSLVKAYDSVSMTISGDTLNER